MSSEQLSPSSTMAFENMHIPEVILPPVLNRVKEVVVPKPTTTSNGELEHLTFWEEHSDLIRDAWTEFYNACSENTFDAKGVLGGYCDFSNNETLSHESFDGMINPHLSQATTATWNNPTPSNEQKLKSIWSEEIPNNLVYSMPNFLTEDGIRTIRHELDRITSVSTIIPTRRPNGMNRKGFIFDDETDGAIPLSSPMTQFTQFLVDRYVRPLGRMFFPSRVGDDDDLESYAFSVRYGVMEGDDLKLNEHRDASVITFNVNLNLSNETYGGSSLYFVNDDDGSKCPLEFKPGMAILHLGSTRHAVLPIRKVELDDHDHSTNSNAAASFERHNLVIWLFGRDGYVRVGEYKEEERLSVGERWALPSSKDENSADLDILFG